MFWWEKLARIEAKLNQLLALVTLVLLKENRMAGELDTLEADVVAEKTVIGSVVTLLQKLSAELTAALAAGDMTRVAAVNAKIEANTKALADAVVANTPAA